MPTRIEDLLDLDSLLTPEDIELRQTVRRFGEQRLRPHIAEWLEAGVHTSGAIKGLPPTLPATAPRADLSHGSLGRSNAARDSHR
jgi:hypothetical protein